MFLCLLGARFSKAPETLGSRKAIFSSIECKIGEVYTTEISCMIMFMLRICEQDSSVIFAMAFRARNVSGAFEKRAHGIPVVTVVLQYLNSFICH